MATGSSKATSPNTELDEDDLGALYEALYPARNSYKSIGLLIGVKIGEIESIESNKTDPGDRLLAILSVRLNKAEALTWNEIDSALRSECVDKSRLADKLRQKYGHLFIPESSTESESEQEHEIKSEEIKRVNKRSPKKQRGGDHRARVSKERERSSEYEGIETVRSKKHVQAVESGDEEDAVLSRKEKKEKVKRKGAHYQYREVHDKERPKGKNKKERFMKDESQSEPEEVVREKSKRKKKATHDKEESVKGYGDRDHYSDTEVSGKVRKRSKKHSKKREVYTESESEASSDEDEMENSSFDDDTSQKGSARRKLTKHTQVKIKERYPQKEHRKDEKKKDAKFRDIQYSDEDVSTKSAKKVETESEEESSSASSSDEEFHKSTKKSKHTETKSAARTKDTAQYESEEKGKTSGKNRVSLKPKSATAKEASHYPEEYKDKGRKKAVRVDEKVGKSTDSSRETYHKTRSKPPRKETEGRDGKREVVSGKKAKKATAPPLERDLPSSEMAQTDSGDGESDESSEDENESEQQSSDEEEETENDSTAEENEEKRTEKSRKSKEKATHPTTEMRKTKSQDDENPRRVKGKKLSKAAGAPSKDDSHGDKEESDAGSSRDQEDQPKKRNRRRHRESSKSPKVRGGSSPSSSQEERKPGSRRQRRTPKHGGKYKRKEKKKRRETSSSSSDTDSSSPESEMMKNLTKSEKKKLRKVFKYSFGQLCSASFNPVETAVQLQKKGLISQGMMIDIIRSPESQQDKIIRLVCGLDNRIRSRPECLFGCIEVLLENDALQEVGREMLRQTGKPFTHQAQGIFVMVCISSSLQV